MWGLNLRCIAQFTRIFFPEDGLPASLHNKANLQLNAIKSAISVRTNSGHKWSRRATTFWQGGGLIRRDNHF
jgi:hypothetical protein